MQVRFWGVRGSVPVSGPDVVRTGGNTSCVEVIQDGTRLVIDGGTGLKHLGDEIGFAPVDLTILFTHTHWDHIQGVPFFTPAYHPDSRIRFAGPTRDGQSIRDVLASQMRPPTFPIRLEDLAAKLEFVEIGGPGELELGPFRARWAELNHPDRVWAFRLSAGGRSVVHATDLEHASYAGGALDDRLIRFSEGADLLIHDAQYTRDEYLGVGGPRRVGWGHSTWCEAVSVARAASVGRLALFHHDPRRSDAQVDALEREAANDFGPVFAAREGAAVGL